MPLTDLSVADTCDEETLSDADSLDAWPSLDVSIVGGTAVQELIAHRMQCSPVNIFNTMRNLTPPPPDAEDWDESAWVTPVFLLEPQHIAAIRDISEADHNSVAEWWFSIDTLRQYRDHVSDFTQEFVSDILSDIKVFLRSAGSTPVLMRCGT